MLHRYWVILGVLLVSLLTGTLRADTFQLNNGKTVTGEALAASANETGIQIKTGEGEYDRVPWASFSQEDLKKLRQTKKLEPFVEPFIEVSQEQKLAKTEVGNLRQPPRLERPARQSLLGAMFSSSLGLLILLALYAGNIYAGYEIAVFRAQPPLLVCGVAAVLPVVGPIIYLCMPTKVERAGPAWDVPEGEEEAAPAPAAAPAAPATPGYGRPAPVHGTAAPVADPNNPMQGAVAPPPGLHIEHAAPAAAPAELPPSTRFQRGQFTFNRRFIETKFAGFFGVVRKDAEKDMVLQIKSARGEYIATRISRIAANDFHVQVTRGPASEEVMIPFVEIQEIVLRHKDGK